MVKPKQNTTQLSTLFHTFKHSPTQPKLPSTPWKIRGKFISTAQRVCAERVESPTGTFPLIFLKKARKIICSLARWSLSNQEPNKMNAEIVSNFTHRPEMDPFIHPHDPKIKFPAAH